MRARLAWLLSLLALGGCSPFPPAGGGGHDGVPSVSAPLALSPDGRTLWVVNPDADSVTPVDVRTLEAGRPLTVGDEPWAVAVRPDGSVVVMTRGDGTLSLLQRGTRRDLRVGPEPGGLALAPSGRTAYVTLSSADEVAVVDLNELRVTRRASVGRMPWSIAVGDDGDGDDDDEPVVVTHRLARLLPDGSERTNAGKEGWLTLLGDRSTREVVLPGATFGHANALEGLTLVGDSAWIAHQLARPEPPSDFENTVSSGLSSFDVGMNVDPDTTTLDVGADGFSTPTNFPRAVAVAADRRTAYLALAGTDAVMGIDLAGPNGPELIGFWPAGANPRGIVIDAAGERAYVMNFLSRDVSVLDLADRGARRELARVPVAEEPLDEEIARGKRLFNNANDPRLSHLGWISCASCHLDGGVDGVTWSTPDGPRQTMPLWRLDATAPFHASATRDELHDFEHDIEGLMDGTGLAPGPPSPGLGEPNAGRSADLDALATYLLHGIRVPVAADADADVVASGGELFRSAGCAGCHAGPAWTVSELPGPVGTLAPAGEVEIDAALRDVGTFRAGSDVLGANGFDVPTLLGLHATAPYLHDGSAATLEAVLALPEHAAAPLTPSEVTTLATFLGSIDANTEPVVVEGASAVSH